MNAVALVIGGAVGAVVRFVVTRTVQQTAGFPVGTALVNVVGAFTLGWVAARYDADSLAFAWQAGFLGGLTTFSTWMVETIALLPSRAVAAVVNTAGLLVAGVALAALGFWMGG